MVEILELVAARGLGVDAVGVEDERLVSGVDADAHRSLCDECGLERDEIVGRHVVVAGELSANGGVLEVAVAVGLQILTVGLFGGNAAVLDDPVVGAEVLAAVAAVVAEAPRAVDEVLRGEAHKRIVLDEESALDGARRAERPAAAAYALVFDGRDGAEQAPVEVGRQVAEATLVRQALVGLGAGGACELAGEHAQLLVRSVGEVVDGERVGERLTVHRADVAQIVTEDVLALDMLDLGVIRHAVLGLEVVEGGMHVRLVAVDELTHRVGRGAVLSARARKVTALHAYTYIHIHNDLFSYDDLN